MKPHHVLLALASSLALAFTGSMAATVKAYKWVDKDGVVHYGDTVPPEYSEQAHQQLNQQGVAVRDFPRQLSPAEAAVAQKTAADEAKREQHDSYLLNNYTRVGDIEQLRDERIALIGRADGTGARFDCCGRPAHRRAARTALRVSSLIPPRPPHVASRTSSLRK